MTISSSPPPSRMAMPLVPVIVPKLTIVLLPVSPAPIEIPVAPLRMPELVIDGAGGRAAEIRQRYGSPLGGDQSAGPVGDGAAGAQIDAGTARSGNRCGADNSAEIVHRTGNVGERDSGAAARYQAMVDESAAGYHRNRRRQAGGILDRAVIDQGPGRARCRHPQRSTDIDSTVRGIDQCVRAGTAPPLAPAEPAPLTSRPPLCRFTPLLLFGLVMVPKFKTVAA